MGENGWAKKIHVTSSLKPKKNQYALFIGRWQPLHDAHKQMFQQVLNEGGNVAIGIREGEVDENNPFTALDVFDKICDEYKDLIEVKRVRVFIVPDICSVNFGRGVGYDIIEHLPPPEVFKISATHIREKMRSNGEL